MSRDLTDLREKLKEAYNRTADERGPSEGEIQDAFATLAEAWARVAPSVTSALKDPEIRDRLRQTVGSFASALGATITGLGAELKEQDGVSEEE